MARPLRVHLADGWYHAFSRGLNRMTLFADDRDRTHFLELLEESVERYRLRLHAYALMDNHYHLLVQTPDANLSRAMQWLNLSYAAWFNTRHQRTGPVFQRPYKAAPVENGAWAYELSLYVHLDPLRIESLGLSRSKRKAAGLGLAQPPSPEEVQRRRQRLREYAWSSYRYYAGYAEAPSWLFTEELYRRTGPRSNDAAAAYRRAMQVRLRQGAAAPKLETLRDGLAVGGAAFARRMRQAGRSAGRRRGIAGKRALRSRVTIQTVIRAVEKVKGERWNSFKDRYGDLGLALAMWAARGFTGLTLKDIGAALGGLDYAAVSVAVRRLESRARADEALAAQQQTLRQLLNVEMSP